MKSIGTTHDNEKLRNAKHELEEARKNGKGTSKMDSLRIHMLGGHIGVLVDENYEREEAEARAKAKLVVNSHLSCNMADVCVGKGANSEEQVHRLNVIKKLNQCGPRTITKGMM